MSGSREGTSKLQSAILLFTIVLLMLMLAPGAVGVAHAETEATSRLQVCGDADGNATVTVSDVVYLINYIFNSGPGPIDGEADGCSGINVGDIVYLINYIFDGGPDPFCPAGGPCPLPTGQNAVILNGCPYQFPSGQDSIEIEVYMSNDIALGSFSLGFSYNSTDFEMTSAVTGTEISALTGSFQVSPRPADNEILVGWVNLNPTIPIPVHLPGSEFHAFTMYLTRVPGAASACIDINSTFVAPSGEFIFVPQNSSGIITPDYVDCGTEDVEVGVGGCTVCGDVDGTGTVSIGDAVYIINYIFSGGPEPCFEGP